MSSDKINFVIALMTAIGIAIGVLISLIPIELIRKRENYQNIIKIWSIIRFDCTKIRKHCIDEHNYINEKVKGGIIVDHRMQLIEISHIATTTWQIIASSGDFISQTSSGDIDKLAEIYSQIKIINEEINRYMSFTYKFGIISADAVNVVERVIQHYERISSIHSTVAKKIQIFEHRIDKELLTTRKKLNKYTRVIHLLMILGIIFLIVVCFIYVYFIINL